MKKSFELLSELLPLIEAYEQCNDDANVNVFLEFAYAKKQNTAKEAAAADKNVVQTQANQVGFYLNMLFRFMKIYTKTALKTRDVATMDDFSFLATIHQIGSIRKTDLIKNNMIEIPSGIEIIKRLVKNNLVSEHPDEQDKRAVLLKITDYGKSELFEIFAEMNKVGLLLAGNLSTDELSDLHHLLEKLAHHHQKAKDIDLGAHPPRP
jgi:MarR family transcriptional regulator, lower aerobic nicotinate degradation pathway regulator